MSVTPLSRPQWGWAAAIALTAIALRLAFMGGIMGSDDLSLASLALRLLDDGWRLPLGHYEARMGLILPLAGIFSIFGVGIAQLVAIPFLASLLGLLFAFLIGRRLFGPSVGLVAAAALAIYPMDIEFAGLYFPDLIVGVALAGAFLAALRGSDRPQDWWYGLIGGAAWAFAYFVKIDVVFFGLVLALGWALGFIRFRVLLAIAATTGGIVLAELLAYWIAAGNPLYRVNLEHVAANEMLAAGHDYRDILTYPRTMFLNFQNSGLLFYFLIPSLILAVRRRDKPALLMAGWLLILLGWLMFGVDPFGGSFRLKPQLERYLW